VAYQVLARKWRPQSFQEIVGQDHVTRTLINAISLGRVAHAYLFAGPRGTGKTSTARIFAKALNCDKGPTPYPCNQCSNCIEIARGESLDVLEIDGASNRGIDEIRDLRGRVDFSPTKGRYKVYIIDEVHMLTYPAFNALLKTLEEPPSHVIFIFATTDPGKLPSTIISRCHRFDFRKIGVSDIVSRLSQIVEKEGIDITPQALQLIAQAAENSMRDAEKILDQLVSYANGHIEQKDVTQVLGLVETEYLAEFTENLYHQDALSNIKLVHKLLEDGKSPQWIIKGWLGWLRDIVMLKIGEKETLLSHLSQKERLIKQTSYFTFNQLTYFIEQLINAEERIKFSSTPQIYLELLMIKLCSQEAEFEEIRKKEPQLVNIYERIVDIEKKLTTFSRKKEKSEEKEEDKKDPDKEDKIGLSVGEAERKQKELMDNWCQVVKRVKEKKLTLGTFLEKVKVLFVDEKKVILGSPGGYIKEVLEKQDNKRLIYEELKKVFSSEFSVQFQSVPSITKKKQKPSDSFREVVAQAIKIFEGEIVSEEKGR